MIHPHLVAPYRLDHESALFTVRNDRVYSHYDSDGSLAAMSRCNETAVTP
jgi:hypothetical protein